MKTLVMLAGPADGAAAALPGLLATCRWAAEASRIVVHIGQPAPVEADGPPVAPIYDAVMEIWSEAPPALADDPALAGWTIRDARASNEVIGKAGDGPPPQGVTPGLSQLSFIRAMNGMPREETERHWQEHIPLAREIHVGMNRYVQDRLADGAPGAWFGMAHLHFPSAAALRDGLFRSPEDIGVITADVAEFVSDHATMLAIEHVVKA